MNVSYLTEMEEFKLLQKVREVFPSIATEGSDLHVLNKYLLKIVTKAKYLPLRSLDADAELNETCTFSETEHLKADVRNKLKAFLIATHVLILDKHPSPDIHQLKWRDLAPLKAAYRDSTEEFGLIQSEDEWDSLLQFRNSLVLALQVVKERNKVLLEMSAGMLSNFSLCMSGGKPSRQVKRRHTIYHTETQTAVKPRKLRACEADDVAESSSRVKKKARIDPPLPINSSMSTQLLGPPVGSHSSSSGAYSPADPFCKLLMLSEVAHQPPPMLAPGEHQSLLNERYAGCFTDIAAGVHCE